MISPLTRQAISATRHCLTGCAIGEILGMVLGSTLGLSNMPTVILSVLLAFLFGYGLTFWSLRASGLNLRRRLSITLASDTLSIASMELADNAIMLAVPGAISAGLTTGIFWVSLLGSLGVAFIVTVPVNRWLIARGLGHAVVHHHHH